MPVVLVLLRVQEIRIKLQLVPAAAIVSVARVLLRVQEIRIKLQLVLAVAIVSVRQMAFDVLLSLGSPHHLKELLSSSTKAGATIETGTTIETDSMTTTTAAAIATKNTLFPKF